MERRRQVVLAAALATLSGCASEPYEERGEAARAELFKAERAGAREREVEQLGDRLDDAEELASRSRDIRSDADDALRDARRRLELAEGRIGAREGMLERARIELEGTRAELAALTAERERHQRRGLDEEEVAKLVGPRLPALEKRVEVLTLVQATLEQQLELARLEREEARRRIQAEDARARSADAMRKLAGMLYDQARVEAAALELETLTRQQRAIERRMEGAGSP